MTTTEVPTGWEKVMTSSEVDEIESLCPVIAESIVGWAMKKPKTASISLWVLCHAQVFVLIDMIKVFGKPENKEEWIDTIVDLLNAQKDRSK